MNSQAATILIVDDDAHNRKLLKLMLKPEGYNLSTVNSGKEALAFIARTPPQLILLDIMMPEMDGYAVAKIIKADAATVNIPIIMVSAQNDHSARLAGLDAGAEDYLTTPVDRAELWLRVRNLLRLKTYSDNERKNSELNLHRLKHYDGLTGLPNRLLFCDILEKTLVHAAEQHLNVAALFIDLDHFKIVNEALGHVVGDELLCQLSNRLIQCTRIRDTIGRFGGDEFALILVMDNGP